MATVRVSIHLADGSVANFDGTVEARTYASALFDAPDVDDTEAQERRRQAEGNRLLRRVNHLLRWYRVVTG